jgi:hypothetical protein
MAGSCGESAEIPRRIQLFQWLIISGRSGFFHGREPLPRDALPGWEADGT